MNRVNLGKYLRFARNSKGFTKKKASIELGYSSDGTINAIEQGRTSIPLERIHDIANLYSLPLPVFISKIKKWDNDLFKRYLKMREHFFNDFIFEFSVFVDSRNIDRETENPFCSIRAQSRVLQ